MQAGKGKLKPLHVAKCMQELKPLFDIPDGKPPRQLCRVAPKLIKQADEFRINGDEERSYIYYMKYLSVIQRIKSSKDYNENPTYYTILINKSQVIAAIETAEKLSSSLQERYKLLQEEKSQDLVLKEEEIKDAVREQKRRLQAELKPPSDSIANNVPALFILDITDVSISCTGLYNMLRQNNSRLLVLDARPASDYSDSHIKMSDSIINVPQDIIKPGVSAAALERSLPPHSKELWRRRGTVDLVVLMDWSTTTRTLTPGSNLYTLKNILLKWDPEIIYKKGPLIVEGGFEEWLLCYPAYTTNCHVVPPTHGKSNNIESLLDSIEYPSFLESTSMSGGDRPGVDRRSKAAAVQAYQERSQAVKRILHDKEGLVDVTLELERRRLGAEEEWERVRLRREKEAEEEMREQLQQREEELLTNISALEKIQKEKEFENQVLREELEEYKKREQGELMPGEEEANARIHSKEEEKRQIAALRERKLREREKRVEEERKNEYQKQKDEERTDSERLQEKEAVVREKSELERQARIKLKQLREERRRKQTEQLAQEKEEREREAQERLGRDREERERLAREQLVRDKTEWERKVRQVSGEDDKQIALKLQEYEKLALERQERDRAAREQREQAALADELREYERAAYERLEQERMIRERQEDEQLTQELLEYERAARQERERQMLKLEEERLAREKREEERVARERREEERIRQEMQEHDRQEKERLAQERQEQEKGMYYTPLKDMASSSSTMKRSHSSPNIAQLDDEDANIRQKVPQFDRTIKPLNKPQPSEIRAARQRNFNPVYGSMGRGLTGLKNLGNTCYMNSVLQCLNNTTPLAVYFCGGEYREDINRHNETRGEVAEEVAAVVRALWSGQFRSIAIRDLRSLVGQHRDQFQTTQQQDSNEFLTILMDWLHEDLKKQVDTCQIRDSRETESEKQWNQFYKDNSSLIVSLFYGQQKSTVRCLRCHEESVRFETFSNLTLPLPSNCNKCTLEDCMRLYLKGERITGWKCPACKEQRDACKKFDILRLPPILVIHFKRFYMDGWCRKRQTFVDFPLSNLDMRIHTILPEQRYTNYNLYGVSNHYGTMEGGHYTAYCKSNVYRKWFKFDDHEVSDLSPSDVKSGAAYILFYASIDYNVPDVS